MNLQLKMIRADETYVIRQQVLWPQKTIEDVKVEADESAQHIGLFVDEKHVGVISLFGDKKGMQFRKLAVLPEYQGFGGGKALIQACIEMAAKEGATMLWCDARVEATGFYQKLGFEIDPVVFVKSGKPYQKAFMRL